MLNECTPIYEQKKTKKVCAILSIIGIIVVQNSYLRLLIVRWSLIVAKIISIATVIIIATE